MISPATSLSRLESEYNSLLKKLAMTCIIINLPISIVSLVIVNESIDNSIKVIMILCVLIFAIIPNFKYVYKMISDKHGRISIVIEQISQIKNQLYDLDNFFSNYTGILEPDTSRDIFMNFLNTELVRLNDIILCLNLFKEYNGTADGNLSLIAQDILSENVELTPNQRLVIEEWAQEEDPDDINLDEEIENLNGEIDLLNSISENWGEGMVSLDMVITNLTRQLTGKTE